MGATRCSAQGRDLEDRPNQIHKARRGRKKAALTYVVTYTIGCFTKHWNIFWVLFTGRLFCGVATSLLYSAFESWLVAEHFKANQAWLVATQRSFSFGFAQLSRCVAAAAMWPFGSTKILIPCLCCVMLYPIVCIVLFSVCETLL